MKKLNKISTNYPKPETPSSQNSEISDSFLSLVQKHLEPKYYSAFATSYLCWELPSFNYSSRDVDEDSTTKEIAAQFKNPILPLELELKGRVDKKLMTSARTKHIIPNTRLVLRQVCGNRPGKAFETQEERQEFLYLKAKQWCEVTKAILLDQRFPKPQKKLMVQRSSAHRKIAQEISKEQEHEENINEKVQDLYESEDKVDESKEIAEEFENIQELVQEILGPPELLGPSGSEEIPWQLKTTAVAKKRTDLRAKRPKLPWKRNIYPPMTEAMRVQQMRKKLPPPKPFHLETDQLSGIWDPALMVPEFKITGPKYDARANLEEEPPAPICLNWYELQFVKEKCWDWLSSYENEF